uniref:Aspartic proteinase nepenthesin-1 n=2 Tax=Cajanus cajan TaxID=3821 RepID=A0A151QL98_CAJCA|nr:Aspartic proteinase nepenthesin-1 [Cajanus cajan]
MLLIVHLTLLSTPCTSKAKPSNGFSVDIFHRDSPLSPFYDPSLNHTKIVLRAAMRSISRSYNLDKVETKIITNNGEYLMRVFIGTPPEESFLDVDTGSGLIWIQCQPCAKCFQQVTPIFDTMKSSTYEKLPCSSLPCRMLPSAYCVGSGDCSYKISYGDGSFSIGEIGSDVISFGPDDKNLLVSFQSTVFGCGYNNSWFPDRTVQSTTGIAGLGNSPYSLVSQVSPKVGRIFSYCLLPFWSQSSGKLRFSFESTQSGTEVFTIPMFSKPDHPFYYVTLNAISVDKTNVTIGDHLKIDMIVDSGSSFTSIPSETFNSLYDEITDSREYKPLANPPPPFKLCYEGLTSLDLPSITFNFSGGAFPLPSSNNAYISLDKLVCLAILPTEDTFSILGSISQVNHKVEYDLDKKTISFAQTDCSLA